MDCAVMWQRVISCAGWCVCTVCCAELYRVQGAVCALCVVQSYIVCKVLCV